MLTCFALFMTASAVINPIVRDHRNYLNTVSERQEEEAEKGDHENYMEDTPVSEMQAGDDMGHGLHLENEGGYEKETEREESETSMSSMEEETSDVLDHKANKAASEAEVVPIASNMFTACKSLEQWHKWWYSIHEELSVTCPSAASKVFHSQRKCADALKEDCCECRTENATRYSTCPADKGKN